MTPQSNTRPTIRPTRRQPRTRYGASPIVFRICLIAGYSAGLASTSAFGQQPQKPAEPSNKPEKEDLGERLIRKAVTDQDEDLMDKLIRLMDESAKRLEIQFDPGRQTQEIQDSIIRQLDDAIQQAASKTQPKSRSQKPSQGERRGSAKPDPQPGKDRKSKPEGRAVGTDPQESTEKGAAAGATDTDGGALRDVRRTWGHLPQRERDEVIQGINEKHIEKFKAWIERYYQALQEAKE